MQISKLLLILSILCCTTYPQLCAVCQFSVSSLATTVNFLFPTWWIQEGIQIMCGQKFDNKKLCQGIGKELAPIAKSNIIHNYIGPHRWCSLVCNHSYQMYYPRDEVDRILNGRPPKEIDLSSYIQKTETTVPQKSQIQILHLSDIHLDMNYTEGSSINCDYPICCHKQDGFPENPNTQAGPYGNKNCDCPLKLFDSLLNFLQTKDRFDIVIATGDFSAHNEWEKSKTTIAENEKRIFTRINETLKPDLLIQAVGNNDYSPDHQYDPKSDGKLLKVVKVHNGKQILTFISLNTMVFDDMNMFTFGDQSYAIFQLMLLEKEIQASENVIILGHISPNLRGASPEYQIVYRALIAKYSGKIKGQFFGHTHMDMLTLNTYPDHSQIPTGFGFISPSVSPYGVSLSRTRFYRFAVAPQAGVIDYTQFKNKNISSTTSEWVLQYSFRNKYKVQENGKPLSLQQMSKIKDMIIESQQGQIQYRNIAGLNEERRKQKLHCQILDDPLQVKKCYGKNLSGHDLFFLIDILRGQWGYDKTEMK